MILVTGGTGLIGSHLLFHLLKSGENVRAIYRSAGSMDITREIFSCYPEGAELFPRIEWMEGDVLDPGSLQEALNGVKDVYHCAAVVSYDPAVRDQMMKVNIEGTANMVNAALSAGIRKFCHVSSIASFGRALRNELVNESTDWENNMTPSTYSISKYYGELEVWRGVEEGLTAVIVNPSVVLGAGNWERGSSALFMRVWKGLPYYTDGVNGYVDVRDVVSCMMRLMKSDLINERYLLVSENWSFRDLLTDMAEELKRKPPAMHVNRLLAQVARWQEWVRCLLSGKSPLITRETVNIAFDSQHYSNEKIKKALDYQFRPVEETIQEVAALFLQSHLDSTP